MGKRRQVCIQFPRRGSPPHCLPLLHKACAYVTGDTGQDHMRQRICASDTRTSALGPHEDPGLTDKDVSPVPPVRWLKLRRQRCYLFKVISSPALILMPPAEAREAFSTDWLDLIKGLMVQERKTCRLFVLCAREPRGAYGADKWILKRGACSDHCTMQAGGCWNPLKPWPPPGLKVSTNKEN